MMYSFSCYKSNDGHLVVMVQVYLKSILLQTWVIIKQIKDYEIIKIALQ